MTFRAFSAALVASALYVLPFTPAHAQDAQAVATALGTALAGGDAARASFSAAREEGGNVVIDGLSIRQAEGGDTMAFATTTVRDPAEAEGGNITASAIEMTGGTLQGETTGTIETVTISNPTILPAAAIAAAGQTQGLTFDAAEAANISLKPKDQPEPMAIERVRIETSNVVDSVPQASRGSAEGIVVPASYFAGGAMGPQTLGYDNLTFDVTWDGARDPQTGTLSVSDFKLAMRDGGTLSLTGELGNVPVGQGADPQANAAAMSDMTVRNLTLRYEDQSLATRILDTMAKQQGISREQYAQQLGTALPFMLSAINNPTFQEQVASAVGAFLNDPKSLTIRVAPANPVSGAQMMQIMQTAPQTLPETLNVTVEANSAQ